MDTETIKKVQRLIGATSDGLWGKLSDRALDAALAARFGHQIPADYFDKLAKIESAGRPYVKAQTSSASGLYQFIRSTWIGEGGVWGGDMTQAFGGLRPTIEEQTARARTFTQKNADALIKAGIPVTSASLYAAHFLGVGTAVRALGQAADTPIEKVTDEGQRKANPSILGRGETVGSFKAWLERKTA